MKIMNLTSTTLTKIYEINFSVSVKYRHTGKVQFQFSNSFLLVSTKFLFWEEDLRCPRYFLIFQDRKSI